jgi:hypothetical protein
VIVSGTALAFVGLGAGAALSDGGGLVALQPSALNSRMNPPSPEWSGSRVCGTGEDFSAGGVGSECWDDGKPKNGTGGT